MGKVVCVGRNYAEHAKELGNEIPAEPILFMKPATSLVALEPSFTIPTHQGSVHHELEIALLIGETAKNIEAKSAWRMVSHVGLALDLTLRDVQTKLKEKSHPWEIAKAFDGACPISKWLPLSDIVNRNDMEISLYKNGQLQQNGRSTQMLNDIPRLLSYMSEYFSLQPGDVILTGTPAGVGPLHVEDELTLMLDDKLRCSAKVNQAQ
ncbi:fumarylacetoacetate hydrolase family protein [Bermanella marisrubri]|uniref:Fumarylacetoacetate hydrolase family protein n=1 Tax=Bermanella marisrubri TaxID=207949 RepID=Q1MZH1_9GAMM|nr:fumarylacetoacetate hydrolase family protein [Bermanella marisrubri]EAT11295.1 fumarylacetoacetate hydrolase family protein [Oceanobacter sp. RED65] [Bermanella marisrubri]